MFKPEVAFYLGREKPEGYSGVLSQDNLFFCLEIHSGISQEEGYKIIDSIKEKIKSFFKANNFNFLNEFDEFISSIITENNLPSGFSMAAGYLKNSILYIKTVGSGKVFIRRKGKIGLLIEGNNTASGQVEDNDFFIFLTENFFDLIGSLSSLEKIFDHRNIHEIIDEITPTLKAKNDTGAAALFINLHKIISTEEEIRLIQSYSPIEKITKKLQLLWFLMKNTKKTLTFFTVLILFFVFLWSVILGYQRRVNTVSKEKISMTKDLVEQKLSTAEQVAFLNMDRALILIKQSRQEVEKVEKEIQKLKIKSKEVDELKKMIEVTENKILKKENRKYSEFFNLRVNDKNAFGSKMYLDNNMVYILDNKNGLIYKLSLDKKSFEVDKALEIKSANIIAGFENESIFYAKGFGVYLIDNNKKIKKIIDKDKDWGEIKDMFIYNGNIYLLDKEKDEIWKYQKAFEGFSEKTSYFQRGQAIDLVSINSMAIDGSIYLKGDSVVIKYTSGLRDGFNIDLPDKNIILNKIITSKDISNVYLWCKQKGTIYVVGLGCFGMMEKGKTKVICID